MSDVPDDLTSIGRHRGNEPPTETGQEVRSPSGPEPDAKPADPSRALFQVVRASDRLQIRVHSPRAQVPAPEEDLSEVGQYRTADALRSALEEVEIDGWTAVFEDAQTGKVLTDPDATADHAWIGNPRYETITFFADEDAANDYLSGRNDPAQS